MRILNRLGGIELSSAYACIKAISKKKQEIIDARRVDFISGAQERGVSKEVAEDIFAKIVYFGGYGFNKSHSCAYAYVSYQTAYLKTHYTPEFMAALLSSEIEDGNKRDIMVDHIADARKMGVEVLPPNVNASDSEFTVYDGKIVFGLTAIKGVGRSSSEEIARARGEGGRFKDLFDFCERVDAKVVNKATIERLIKAGAFDRFGGHRAQLTARAAARHAGGRRSAERQAARPAQPVRRPPPAESAAVVSRVEGDAAGRAAVVGDREAEVREGSARLLPVQPSRWPRTRRCCAASPATPPRR